MNILVTGGAGFIGSNLVHYLLANAKNELGVVVNHVVTLDKLTYAGNRASLSDLEFDTRHTLIKGDICDIEIVASILRNYHIDAVMHLAAESHVDRSIDSPEEFIQTNFVGTYRLLEAFRHYLTDSGRMAPAISHSSLLAGGKSVFLHVSTDEVYGSLGPSDPAFCETTSYAPNSPYSASKAGSDHLVRAYHHTYRLPVITTNCSNNYGPYQFPEKLLPLMIQRTLSGGPLPIYGDGLQIRDWLYVEDHCRGLVMAMLKGVFGETYVIGGNCEMTNIDLVYKIIETVRELAPSRSVKDNSDLITYVTDRPGHDRRYAINPERIKKELGWVPCESFTSGLKRTVRWYLDNEEWIRSITDGSYRGERLGTFT